MIKETKQITPPPSTNASEDGATKSEHQDNSLDICLTSLIDLVAALIMHDHVALSESSVHRLPCYPTVFMMNQLIQYLIKEKFGSHWWDTHTNRTFVSNLSWFNTITFQPTSGNVSCYRLFCCWQSRGCNQRLSTISVHRPLARRNSLWIVLPRPRSIEKLISNNTYLRQQSFLDSHKTSLITIPHM